MTIEIFVFYAFAAMTILSALGVVLLKNVVHSALFLGLSLFGVAGLFACLSADFLFAVQILIYVGGISVLILFAVLLAGRASELIMRQTNEQWLAAGFVCGASLAALLYYLQPFKGSLAIAPAAPTTKELGRLLLGEWAVPFELISLVLLASLAGVIVFSMTEPEE